MMKMASNKCKNSWRALKLSNLMMIKSIIRIKNQRKESKESMPGFNLGVTHQAARPELAQSGLLPQRKAALVAFFFCHWQCLTAHNIDDKHTREKHKSTAPYSHSALGPFSRWGRVASSMPRVQPAITYVLWLIYHLIFLYGAGK